MQDSSTLKTENLIKEDVKIELKVEDIKDEKMIEKLDSPKIESKEIEAKIEVKQQTDFDDFAQPIALRKSTRSSVKRLQETQLEVSKKTLSPKTPITPKQKRRTGSSSKKGKKNVNLSKKIELCYEDEDVDVEEVDLNDEDQDDCEFKPKLSPRKSPTKKNTDLEIETLPDKKRKKNSHYF